MPESIKTLIYVQSPSFNPWHNLALEEFLFRRVADDEVIMYLWQNADTVVIGRNQNAWKECVIGKLNDDNVKLARRLSGGGAVYHDLGNLNFTFIMNRNSYDIKTQLEVILRAVQTFGINAEFTGRNDITVQGKKFSGNAYYFEDERAFHHGTILIDSDINRMQKYLHVSKKKLELKGIDSVSNRVVNLKNINNTIDISMMKNRLVSSFSDVYGLKADIIAYDDLFKNSEIKFKNLYERYSSWSWIYGESPSFDIEFKRIFTWGSLRIQIAHSRGCIENAFVYSDAMNTGMVIELAKRLKGIPFKKDNMLEAVCNDPCFIDDQKILSDITEFIKISMEGL